MDNIFSDEPLGIQEDFENWEEAPEFAPPPPAGTYLMYLAEIREEREFTTSDQRKRLSSTLDFRIIGGEYDDRAITWQRVSNAEFVRKSDKKRTSLMLDLIKSAGVAQAPNSNRDFHEALHSLHDRGPGAPFKAQIDWRGFCTRCNERKLMQLTGAPTAKTAKDGASDEQRREAADFATKANGARQFPDLPGGGKKDTLLCEDCGDEVRAQVQVRRFMR